MTKSQIIKVARAIYAVSAAEADDGERHIPPFERLAPVTKDIYKRMAKAAIGALTSAMETKP